MLKVTVLLDVDETCAISNKFYGQQDGGYRYNDALFAALKQCECFEVYLFTSFNLGSVTSDEAVGTPSRLKLIRYLENQGFKVEGVVTPLDAVFKKGIGAYYEEIIKPFEVRILQGENIRIGSAAPAYQAALLDEMKLVKEASELNVGDKGSLYQYFIDSQREALLYPHFNVVFVDDRPVCLNDVKSANEKYHYPLCLIPAKPQDTVSYYQKCVSDFQYSLEVGYIAQQLKRIKALALDKTQEETYQQLRKEFKPISATPDLLAIRNFSRQVTYFLMTLEKRNAFLSVPTAGLDNPLLQDRAADRLLVSIKAIPGLMELKDSAEPDAILYGLDKPYGLSLETARCMLCKINTTGNSRVGRVNNVFFKQGAEYSLVEQAVYQLSRLLGEELVTPTRLLFLKIPDEDTYALQASLGVGVDLEAIDLDALCQIPEAIAMLKMDLGETPFAQDFPTLLSNDYYQTWLNHSGLVPDMPFEKQLSFFIETLMTLPEGHWPVGLKELYNPPESQVKRLRSALFEAFQDKKAPLRVLALLERYPVLNKNHLNDLIACTEAFECLRFLYPSLRPEAVLVEAERLLHTIDKANLSAHLLLEILTEPEDHKGDNFKVQFRRDSYENLTGSLEIIAIDNDAAMQGVFKSKGGESLLLVKSLLLANKALLNEPIAESVRERCLLMNPTVAIMHWLEALNHYYEPYYALKDSGVIFKGLARRLHLEEQLSLDFITRLSERLASIQQCLKAGVMTHRALWHQVDPLLAYSYEVLSREVPNSQALMTALYHKKKPVFVEKVLATQTSQRLGNGKTLGDLIAALPQTSKNKGYRFYIETLTEYVSEA
ncbi:MAG TPA: hypothetical protein VNK03_05395, partial [Gammaproteobacteria bacterium]|nr:hypothetical protein [Gammaproteobacteria bacterium]